MWWEYKKRLEYASEYFKSHNLRMVVSLECQKILVVCYKVICFSSKARTENNAVGRRYFSHKNALRFYDD